MNRISNGEWVVFFVVVVFALAAGIYTGFAFGEKRTTANDQRAAVLAGTGKWVANKETGSPEFAWTVCTALGVRQ